MIPNVIHFMYFMPNSGKNPFSLMQYLAVKSAAVVNKPEAINFYCNYEPSGEWWEKANPYLNLIKIEPPTQIYGAPLCHPAHQADVVRLQVLIEQGGIYLDMDVICVKPFTPLLKHTFVLGQEGTEEGITGLCNAVILSEKNAFFCRTWMEGFNPRTSLWHGFRAKGRDEYWVEMSINYPDYLAKLFPEHIHVLNYDKFYRPIWHREQLERFYTQLEGSFEGSYCHHLWGMHSWNKYLKDLTVDYIKNVDTTFNCIARRFL